MQSSLQRKIHVAIIMDGNGRWALGRGLPRAAGHRAGAEALRAVVEAAWDLGVSTLTVYAFSTGNWRRPKAEVLALMALLNRYLAAEFERLIENDIRLTVIGRRDRLPAGLEPLIVRAEAATRQAETLHLRIAFDYSAREAILEAALAALSSGALTQEAIGQRLGGGQCDGDVDLLIRTSGEQRLSDFLLWESAYAELYFTRRLWPDFGPDDLAAALADFHRRDRRYGALSPAPIAI